jgi:hypothetical protein
MQVLMRKPSEMMSEAMQEMQNVVKSGAGGVADPSNQADLVRKGSRRRWPG